MERWTECVAEAFEGPLLIADALGQPVWCNSHWQDLVGGCGSDCAAAWRGLVTHDEDLQRWDDVMSVDDGQQGQRRTLVRMVLPPTPEEQWVTFTRTPAVGADGELMGWIDTLVPTHEVVHRGGRGRMALREAEALNPTGAYDWDVESGEIWWSDEVYRIFGVDPATFEPTHGSYVAAVHPDDRERVNVAMSHVATGKDYFDLRYRVVRPDGTVRFVRERGTVTVDQDGTVVRVVGNAVDVTEETLREQAREGAMEALEASEAKYRLLAENASDVVWQLDEHGAITWVSESVRGVIGYAPDAMLGRLAMDFVHPEDVERARTVARADSVDREPEEFRLIAADGSSRWVSSVLHPVNTESGTLTVGSLRDIDGLVRARMELENRIGHDLLTGLALRDATITRIDHHLARTGPGAARVGVLCIRVDSLGTINSAYSHHTGDRVVSAVAGAVVSIVGDVDLVGRGTGNELHVVVPVRSGAEEAGALAERIRSGVTALSITSADAVIKPTVSIGVVAGSTGEDPETILAAARMAASRARRAGHNRYEYLDSAATAEAHQRLAMQDAIRAGLERGEFIGWYQPIARLDDGRVTGHEALVRWINSDGTVRDAWRFVPVAEATGLIADIDVLVMTGAIRQLADDTSDLTLALNVSAASISSSNYATQLRRVVSEHGVDPTRIHLEVTETALLELSDDVRATVARLADEGFVWYVDDFGTGYSSIAHLRDLPISGLKLDRSFTAGVGNADPTCLRLADGLVGLADGLELDTVAEGVETDDVRRLLVEQGWQHGQGWLFGRPEAERRT